MKDERAEILEKIRKLLALAGNNPDEHEATLASERAQEMLLKYNLSLFEVENASKPEDINT